MRRYITISVLLILSYICYANSEKSGHFMNISSKVPKSMMISEIPSWGLDYPHVLSDPNQAIREREIHYTGMWLGKTINTDLFIELNKMDIKLLSGIGNKKDDALMISWNKDQFNITVIDGRFLILSVRLMNEVQADIEAVFRKVVNYWYSADKYKTKVNLETLSTPDSEESWGRIIVDQNGSTGWYEKPVEWHKVGNEVIFAFEKVAKIPVSKIPPQDKEAPNYFGGIPVNDSRSYLRFNKSNREELAKEYFQKKRMKDNDQARELDNNHSSGVPYGWNPYSSEPN